jgi:hypothetical protein
MRASFAAVVFAAVSLTTAAAQSSKPLDPCHAMQADGTDGARNFLTFDRFDKELRTAIRQQDTLALAFLVKFPLTVNDAGGSIAINDAEALKTHFQEIFPQAVRNEILKDPEDDPACNAFGVGYGSGVIWVNATERGYAIEVVNRDAVPPIRTNWNAPKVNYICQTKTHRIAVDTMQGGTIRYRAWKKPKSLTEPPDLELKNGVASWEGSDICSVPVWKFKNGSTTYSVYGRLGCTDGSEPKDATGSLEISIGDNDTPAQWCY